MNNTEKINITKSRFEQLFAEKNIYEKQTRDDGHLAQIISALKFQNGNFYRKEEFEILASKAGLESDGYFITEIRFPSLSRTEGYRKMEHQVPNCIKESYNIDIIDEDVYITEKVLNISFIKPKNEI